MDLYEEFVAIIDLLNEAGLPYAVCGGVAVSIHGYSRFTKDIDLLVQSSDVPRILEVVRQREFDLPVARLPFDVGTPHERWVNRVSKIEKGQLLSLDLLVVTAVYESVWQQRVFFEWEGRKVPVVSLEGLRKMKTMAGRKQDLLDLEQLGLLPENEGAADAEND